MSRRTVTHPITTASIRVLREEASIAGDLALVALCSRALGKGRVWLRGQGLLEHLPRTYQVSRGGLVRAWDAVVARLACNELPQDDGDYS